MFVYFDFTAFEAGKEVVWKVYRDGQEDHSLRWRETWLEGGDGHAVKPISFVFAAAGEYRVEMYYDGHLRQTGTFSIKPRE